MAEEREKQNHGFKKSILRFLSPQDEASAGDPAETAEKDADTHRVTEAQKRSVSYFARAVPRPTNPFGLSRTVTGGLGIALFLLVVLNVLAFSHVTVNRIPVLSERILYLLRADGIAFQMHSLLQIQIILALILSFLLGGIVLFMLLRLAETISKGAGLSLESQHLTYLMLFVTAVYLILFIVSRCLGNAYDTYWGYRFLAPFLTNFSGLLLYALSRLRFEV